MILVLYLNFKCAGTKNVGKVGLGSALLDVLRFIYSRSTPDSWVHLRNLDVTLVIVKLQPTPKKAMKAIAFSWNAVCTIISSRVNLCYNA